MSREVLAAVLLAMIPSVAFAQPSSVPTPVFAEGASMVVPEPEPPANDAAVALTFAPEFGAGLLPASDALDESLRAAERSELGTLAGAALGSRFGLQVYGVSLSATIGAVFIDADDAPNASYLERDWVLVEISYDVFPQSWLTLSPVVGAGVHVSRLCVSGPPTERTGGTLFEQTLDSPGSETCLEEQQAVGKLGFVGGVAAPLPVDDAVLVATLDLRPSITWALGDGSYEILHEDRIPSFEGPGSSRTAFSIMLDVGFVFGFGQR